MKAFRKTGFTLIELLVVIAIIAILAAILFPVFAQAKAAAKGAVCLSNVKQITLAGLMYSNDVDDQIVPSYTLSASQWELPAVQLTNPVAFWSDLIQPYVKSGNVTPTNYQEQHGNGIFQDPAASVSLENQSSVYPGYDYAGRSGYTVLADYAYAVTGFGGLHDYITWLYDGGTYGGNHGLCPGDGNGAAGGTYGVAGSATNPCMNPPGNGPGVPGTFQSQTGGLFSGTFVTNTTSTSVARPADTIIVSDGITMVGEGPTGPNPSAPGTGPGTVPTFTLYTWPGGGDAIHNGGGNYGFVDGHAKRIARNPLDYVTLDSGGGYYFMTYLTMSE